MSGSGARVSDGMSDSRGRAWRRRTGIAVVAALILSILSVASPAAAVTLPSGFAQSTFASGLGRVTAMTFAPDGRLFVASQDGYVRVVKNGATLPTPFVKLTTDDNVERGLTGIALDPNFASNGYVYLYYATTTTPIHNRVARFVANGDVALTSGGVPVETPILELDNLSSNYIHNGGAMNFGSDGKLYVAVGENAVGSNAQSMNNLLGKILRINADGSIPTDNPFYGTATGKNRAIWALGFRNPFTFAFQPGTDRMFVNDVGNATWEEVNDTVKGGNYGWPTTEGATTDARFRGPIYAYQHAETATVHGCAITGGAFYNPATVRYPADYVGDYFFADYCEHWIKRFDPVTKTVTNFASATTIHPVDLKVGPDGNLYYLSRGTGTVVKITYGGSGVQAPGISDQPASQTVSVGATASFSVVASGTAPLSYQWQRNGVAISGATSSTYTKTGAALADNGARFRVVVTNSAGSVTSSEATLTVQSNLPPTGTITAPVNNSPYSGGQVINYAGTGTDPEDGTLPASAFTWTIDFHHGTHMHPFLPPTTGSRSGSFTIDNADHTETNVWYRIHLTVKDSAGRTQDSYVDIKPRVVDITVRTVPAGLSLNLDDQPRSTPYTEPSTVGVIRRLAAPSPQTVGGVTYAFQSWSDGGAASHSITTPSSSTTYTATFAPVTAASTVTLQATADSYGNNSAKSSNYGTSGSMAAGTNYAGYLRFVVPAAPAGKQLLSATLSYRTTALASAGSTTPQSIRFTGGSWQESTLTWNNRPAAVGDAIGSTPSSPATNTRYSAALNAGALQARLGTTVNLLVTGGADSLWFWSRNHATASYRPQLILVFG